jgi:hypothetical protein
MMFIVQQNFFNFLKVLTRNILFTANAAYTVIIYKTIFGGKTTFAASAVCDKLINNYVNH